MSLTLTRKIPWASGPDIFLRFLSFQLRRAIDHPLAHWFPILRAVNSCWRRGGRGVTLELRLLVWWPAAIERLAYLCLTLCTRLCSRINDKTNDPVPILFPNPHTPRSSL